MDAGPATREERNALASAPAGEATQAARVVALSRAALAARIKHGVPLAELTSHFVTLSIAEGVLLKLNENT